MATRFDEMADRVVEAAKGFLTRGIAPLRESVAGLIGRVDKHGQQLESAERRLSRQGEHLSRLEDRVRKLEGK